MVSTRPGVTSHVPRLPTEDPFIANAKRKPEANVEEIELVDQILLRVLYVSLPDTWEKTVQLLKQVDQHLHVKRPYAYAPKPIRGALVKLQ
jgi:hypothetical protein